MFGSIRKLFGVLLTSFKNSTEILCYFLKTPKFGRSPEILGAGDTSGHSAADCTNRTRIPQFPGNKA